MNERDYAFEVIPVVSFEMTRTIREETVVDDNRFYILAISTPTTLIDIGLDRSPELIEYIKANNIPCTMYRNKGGTLIMTPEDLAFMVFYPKGLKEKEAVSYLKEKFVGFIEESAGGHTLTYDNNDILLDGFKVSSFSSSEAGYVQMFNFNVNEDVIRGIPLKEAIKKPRGLTEFTGKTKANLLEYISRTFPVEIEG